MSDFAGSRTPGDGHGPAWMAPNASNVTPKDGPSPASSAGSSDMQDIKGRIHRQLLDRLNLQSIESLAREEVVGEIRKVVHDLLTREAVPLNLDEREDLVEQVLDEIFGLG